MSITARNWRGVAYETWYYEEHCCWVAWAQGIRGQPIGDEPAMPHELYPGETMLERARRLDLIDRWQPVVYVKQPCNHGLLYEGRCALEIWKAWNARVFGKRKKKDS